MRFFYTFLFYLLLPFALLRLFLRGFKAPDYRKRWGERLGFYTKKYPSQVIWIHAVSLGEVEAVSPLLKQLQKLSTANHLLVTTTTPTGSSRVQGIFGDTVSHVYLPYDLPWVIKRFLAVFKPKIAIIMEKEIWPNLFFQCTQQKIPLLIINARLSAKSAKSYKKISGLIKPILANISWIATQTEEDRQHFIEMGAREKLTKAMGNIKFDLELDDRLSQQAYKLKKQLFSGRFIWLISSTHEGEEQLFCEIYPILKKQIPELLIIIVPRHPERFTSVATLVKKNQLNYCLRSTGQACHDNTDIYLVDTMGELKLFYGTADICFVAGSLIPAVGGHNILEPAAINIPIMFGPHMTNFKEIAQHVLDCGAAIQVSNKEEIIKTVLYLHNDPEYRNKMSAKAKQFIKNNQGASQRIFYLIKEIIEK